MIKEKEEIYDLKRERMLEYEKLKAGRVKFVSEFSEEDKHIARFLFLRRDMFDDIKDNYFQVKDFISKILKSFDYDNKFISEYIKRYDVRLLYLKTVDELYSRFAILNMACISENDALMNPRILYIYSDNIIYETIKYLKNNGYENIDIDIILDFIPEFESDFENKKSSKFAIDYLTRCYKKKSDF